MSTQDWRVPESVHPADTSITRLILGREPAVLFESIAAVLYAVVLLLPLAAAAGGALNVTISASAALATAIALPEARDRVLPSLLAVVRGVLAAVIAFGMSLPEPTQAGILALVGALAALFVRQNVRPTLGASPRDDHPKPLRF